MYNFIDQENFPRKKFLLNYSDIKFRETREN